MFSIAILALVTFAGGVFVWLKRRQCQHRFGVPMRGTVCCMKCTRRYAIEATADGSWRISRTPLPAPLADGDHPRSSSLS